MILGIYGTLGVFLIRASRDPMAHRSLIWFTVWSSVVHSVIMAVGSVIKSAAHWASVEGRFCPDRRCGGARVAHLASPCKVNVGAFIGHKVAETIVHNGTPAVDRTNKQRYGRFQIESVRRTRLIRSVCMEMAGCLWYAGSPIDSSRSSFSIGAWKRSRSRRSTDVLARK